MLLGNEVNGSCGGAPGGGGGAEFGGGGIKGGGGALPQYCIPHCGGIIPGGGGGGAIHEVVPGGGGKIVEVVPGGGGTPFESHMPGGGGWLFGIQGIIFGGGAEPGGGPGGIFVPGGAGGIPRCCGIICGGGPGFHGAIGGAAIIGRGLAGLCSNIPNDLGCIVAFPKVSGLSDGGASPNSAIKLMYSSSILACAFVAGGPPAPGRLLRQSLAI